jgi:hypothetical protein
MTDNADDRFPVLIERRLKIQRAPGEPVTEIVIEIGGPYWTQVGVEAACPVAIRGAIGRVKDIRNIDPMSAMKSAISFVETYLKPRAGEKLFWIDGTEYSVDEK